MLLTDPLKQFCFFNFNFKLPQRRKELGIYLWVKLTVEKSIILPACLVYKGI